LPSMVKAESFSDHPRTEIQTVLNHILQGDMDIKSEMQEQGFKHFVRDKAFQYHKIAVLHNFYSIGFGSESFEFMFISRKVPEKSYYVIHGKSGNYILSSPAMFPLNSAL